jgi:hypothetical protein
VIATTVLLSRRARPAAYLLAGALALSLGCNSGIIESDPVTQTLAHCGQRVEGAHYTVCGHWSTLARSGVTDGRLVVRGAVDSAPGAHGASYAIQGGTFHAN